MSRKNFRITITLGKPVADVLAILAKKERRSVAMVAQELIIEALELREDSALSKIAHMREREQCERVKHTDVWK